MNIDRNTPLLILVAALGLCTGSLRADVFVLKHGGRIQGQALGDPAGGSYRVQTVSGAVLTIETKLVDEVLSVPRERRQYEAAVPGMADTLDAHLAMAVKCRDLKLKEELNFHLEQVLRHEPDHESARHALGYSRVNGEWKRQGDFLAEQGYVKTRGGWRLPEGIAIERYSAESETKRVQWRKQVAQWRSFVLKNRTRVEEGVEGLRGVRDPLAVPALAEFLKKPKERQALKLIYLDALGSIQSDVAAMAIIDRILNDADPRVRERALDRLPPWASRLATTVLAAALKDNDNRKVQRAGSGLARARNPESTMQLIDGLVTKHKHVVGGGNQMTPVFTKDNNGNSGLGGGLGGMSAGNKARIVIETKKNDTVLQALTGLHPGVNFGYDQEKWRAWYIEQNTPDRTNLRRTD